MGTENLDSGSTWADATVELRRELARAIPRDTLRELHRPVAARHFLVLAWQLLLLVGGTAGAWILEPWHLWLPCSIVVGLTIFNFTIMLHEVVHHTVFASKRPWAIWLLGQLYAFPSGISASQFERWHLDHHKQLGDEVKDPKRHHLSPKRHVRWYKFLYCTPALFLIYFTGAGRETRTYDAETIRKIRIERFLTIAGHVAWAAALVMLGGWWVAWKAYFVPYLFVFPAAFTLNRLGQHYDIDPEDPAKWSTLIAPHWFWDIAYLWSRYHLEHHYFPRVPFYRLRALHIALRPFYKERGLTPRTYRGLLWGWFVQNRTPHTNWHA